MKAGVTQSWRMFRPAPDRRMVICPPVLTVHDYTARELCVHVIVPPGDASDPVDAITFVIHDGGRAFPAPSTERVRCLPKFNLRNTTPHELQTNLSLLTDAGDGPTPITLSIRESEVERA